jgi:hypothetical protein
MNFRVWARLVDFSNIKWQKVKIDEFVKSIFTTEYTESTEKIFLITISYLCWLCALRG